MTDRYREQEPSDHGRYEDWLPAYALGALDGDELHELESHLRSGCERCAGLLRGWEGDLEALAAEAPPLQPSPLTRSRLMRRIGDSTQQTQTPTRRRAPLGALPPTRPAPARPTPVRPTRSRIAVWALAASIAAMAFSLGALWSQLRWSGEVETALAERDRVEGELARVQERMQEELGRARAEVSGLRTHVERLTVSVQSLGGGGRTYALAGLEGAPDAGGTAFVDPRTRRAVFHAYGLPPAPAGKTYQLWWIAEGQPVSAGIFDIDETGSASLEIEGDPPASLDLWAVTVEPAGGVPQPTGAMVLKS